MLACFLPSESGLRGSNFVLLYFPGVSIILFARFDFESVVDSPEMLAALTYVFVADCKIRLICLKRSSGDEKNGM